jgi:hypothetical protein
MIARLKADLIGPAPFVRIHGLIHEPFLRGWPFSHRYDILPLSLEARPFSSMVRVKASTSLSVNGCIHPALPIIRFLEVLHHPAPTIV